MNVDADFAAVCDGARVNGLAQLYDSGDLYNDERQVIFGDTAAAADWDRRRIAGYQVVVNFDPRTRRISSAHATQDGVPQGDLTRSSKKTAGQVLESTLIMLSAATPHRYLSQAQFEERLGLAPRSLSKYKLPSPDAVIGPVNDDGTLPRGTMRGWLPETIDEWHARRPGQGARTDVQTRERLGPATP